MTLSEKDGQLFYKLWLPLLDYVNEKCKVNKNVKDMANAKSLDPQVVKEIANVLWDDVSIIDQYLIDQRLICLMNTRRSFRVGNDVFRGDL